MHLNLRKIIEVYNVSAGVLLMMFAAATTLMIIAGAGYLQPYDPVFGIPIRVLGGVVGIVSLFVACCCFFSLNCRIPSLLVMWLTVNFYIYLFGLRVAGCNTLAGFFGDSIYCFGISPGTANIFMICGAIYLTAGSCITCLMAALSKPVVETTLTMSCPACGIHIRFDNHNLGQKIPCPQCQKTITLRRSENLKMSCFFCQEHIEFPAHAIGEKMPCPHCKMDITLKEPA